MLWYLLIPVLFYFLFIRKIYSNVRFRQPFRSNGSPAVMVSVIIPCKNEENNLPHILSDLESQEYNPDLFEVIVVDDRSDDNTFKIASGFRGIRNYKTLRNPDKGKKSSIGHGISNASGELILTTDADCRFSPKWISAHASAFSDFNPAMIIGPVQLEEGRGFFSKFQELEFLSLQGITFGTAIAGKPVMCNGANLSFTKSVYLIHSENLHNEILSGDDIFLLHSLKKDPDAKIIWLNSMEGMVTTRQSDSLLSFLRQRARWISKAGYYNDVSTISLAAVTFATILSIVFLLFAGIVDPFFWLLLLMIFIIKSIPDYLLLRELSIRYKKTGLLRWFLPVQLIYPFYVLGVFIFSFFGRKIWK